MPRRGSSDEDEAQIYTQASGCFLRDFDLSREKEFRRPKDHPKDWREFECMLGNCCDRLLHDIDDRFKNLAEYLWDKVEVDGATPEVIRRTFQHNLDQIDQYLVLQFDHAKEQLENMMWSKPSSAASSPERFPLPSNRSSGSAGFPLPSNRSSNLQNPASGTNISSRTKASGSGSGSRPSSTSSNSLRSALYRSADLSGSPSTRPTSGLPVPKMAANTAADSDSASYASADEGGSPTRLRASRNDDLRRQRSGGSSDTTAADSGSQRDQKRKLGSPSTASFTSICRRALSNQLPFGLGVLAGATAVIALLFFGPYLIHYLPASVTENIPLFNVFFKDGAHSHRLNQVHLHATQSKHANRKKPYDAFWTSCGHSFVDWWAYSWQLLYA